MIQALLWSIVGEDFFHTNVVENFGSKSIPFCLNLWRLFHLQISMGIYEDENVLAYRDININPHAAQ